MTKEIEFSRIIPLEFQAYTGITEFNINLFLDIQPNEVIVRNVIKHNINPATNAGLASLYSSLPINSSNNCLFNIGQTNDYLQLDYRYTLNNKINGNYNFKFILSGANGLPLLNADIVVVLEFVKYKQ